MNAKHFHTQNTQFGIFSKEMRSVPRFTNFDGNDVSYQIPNQLAADIIKNY